MYYYMNLLIDISHNPLKLCEYILSIIFRLLELYDAGALNSCEFVINVWNNYVVTCSGGVIMMLVSKFNANCLK